MLDRFANSSGVSPPIACEQVLAAPAFQLDPDLLFCRKVLAWTRRMSLTVGSDVGPCGPDFKSCILFHDHRSRTHHQNVYDYT